jgi:hypothetical protein
MLVACLFNSNVNASVIAHDKERANRSFDASRMNGFASQS